MDTPETFEDPARELASALAQAFKAYNERYAEKHPPGMRFPDGISGIAFFVAGTVAAMQAHCGDPALPRLVKTYLGDLLDEECGPTQAEVLPSPVPVEPFPRPGTTIH